MSNRLVALAAALLLPSPLNAASEGYCSLWSRDVAELEVRIGAQLNLTFAGNDLVYSQKDDPDIAVADANLVEIRANDHYRTCLMLTEFDALPLPDVPAAQTPNWAARVASYAIGRQGTEPAAADPTPKEGGTAEWRAACAEQYRTWNEADGTVVRRGSPEPVKCPLVFKDGEWIVE
jgi:hypothetical protein